MRGRADRLGEGLGGASRRHLWRDATSYVPRRAESRLRLPGSPRSSTGQVLREKGGGRIRDFTRFERARIIGARALQIAMGAPVILAIPADLVDPVDIAELEFEKGLIPITVRREL